MLLENARGLIFLLLVQTKLWWCLHAINLGRQKVWQLLALKNTFKASCSFQDQMWPRKEAEQETQVNKEKKLLLKYAGGGLGCLWEKSGFILLLNAYLGVGLFFFFSSIFFPPPLENIGINSRMTNNKERGLDFNQALWVKPVWVSLFCTFVSCGQPNTKTTWNKTFGEGTRNSWAKQLLLPPEGSFNRADLKCKNTNSYLRPTGSEEGVEYGFWKEGGKIAFFLSSEWEGLKSQIPSLWTFS